MSRECLRAEITYDPLVAHSGMVCVYMMLGIGIDQTLISIAVDSGAPSLGPGSPLPIFSPVVTSCLRTFVKLCISDPRSKSWLPAPGPASTLHNNYNTETGSRGMGQKVEINERGGRGLAGAGRG